MSGKNGDGRRKARREGPVLFIDEALGDGPYRLLTWHRELLEQMVLEEEAFLLREALKADPFLCGYVQRRMVRVIHLDGRSHQHLGLRQMRLRERLALAWRLVWNRKAVPHEP